MSDELEENVKALVAAASKHGERGGLSVARAMRTEAAVLLDWLGYLRESEVTGVADTLLDGTQGAIGEAVACLTLGLVRPALSSLRAEIDMVLGWLYFKDHRVEWNNLRDTGRGFQTRAQVLDYLGNHWPQFRTRLALLDQCSNRKEDPYRILSAHIHGQTDFTSPNVSPLADLVADERLCMECVTLQHDVAEYIGDVLTAIYGDRWASLPDVAQRGLNRRLTNKQRAKFFPRDV